MNYANYAGRSISDQRRSDVLPMRASIVPNRVSVCRFHVDVLCSKAIGEGVLLDPQSIVYP